MKRGVLSLIVVLAGSLLLGSNTIWAQNYNIKTLSELSAKTSPSDSSMTLGSTSTASVATLSTFDTETVIKMLDDYLQETVGKDFQIQLLSNLTIASPHKIDPYQFTLRHIQIDDQQTHVQAQLIWGTAADQPLAIEARLEALIDLPVLINPVNVGDTITNTNITWQKFPVRRLQGHMATQIEDLVGLQPRNRVLMAHAPLRKQDLIKPQLVKKGTPVRVCVESQGLSIQMQGKALDNGSQGDEVRVMNTTSNKVLSGIVQDTGLVIVTAPIIHNTSGDQYAQP